MDPNSHEFKNPPLYHISKSITRYTDRPCILLARVQISINIDKTVIHVDSALLLFIATTETAHFAIITGLAEIPIKFTHTPHWGEPSSGDDNIQKNRREKMQAHLDSIGLRGASKSRSLELGAQQLFMYPGRAFGWEVLRLAIFEKVSEG